MAGKNLTTLAILLWLAFSQIISAQPAKTYTLPFKSVDGLMLVTVTVDSKPLTLILDTGAAATFISGDALGIGVAGDLHSNHDSHVITGHARLRNVTLGLGKSMFNQDVTVISLKELSGRLGVRCDGILGADFLTSFSSLTINYKAHTVELVK